MVQSKPTTDVNGLAEDLWVSGMRQAGFSEQEINRVVTATATIARPENGADEFVSVKEAARRIGRSENTVRSWIRLGHLKTVEITPPRDHANGPWVHVDMADVEELNHQTHPEDGGDLITLREAAERFGLTLSRVQGWHKNGYLRTRGHRMGRGGEAALIEARDMADLVANPPRPGPHKDRGAATLPRPDQR